MPNTLTSGELLIHITNEKGTPAKEVKRTIMKFRKISERIAEKSIELGINNKVIKKNGKDELVPLVKSQF